MVNTDESDESDEAQDNCTIPGPVPTSILNNSVIDRPEHEEKRVREYVELETDETVTFLEKD